MGYCVNHASFHNVILEPHTILITTLAMFGIFPVKVLEDELVYETQK